MKSDVILQTAVFSQCGRYRYSLARVWQPDLPCVCWIMLNPSKASADRNDPTVRRCIAYARRWGFGGIVVVNLFAMIATYPVELCRARDPVGPRNDDAILEGIRGRRVLLAWGTLSGWMPRHMVDRDVEVLRLLESTRTPAECLRVTKSGYPSHPVRLPRKLMPVPYERRAS